MLTSVIWAVVVLIIALFFMIYFNKEIRSAIGRTREISRRGWKMSDNTVQGLEGVKVSSTEELMQVYDSPTICKKEDAIRKELDEKNVNSEMDKVKILIRHLSYAHLLLAFERIVHVIYGSQICILESLNTFREGSSSEVVRREFYERATKDYPDIYKNYPFENYMLYLKNSNLIIEKDNQVFITELGVEFLAHLAKVGLSAARFLRPG